MLPLFQNRFLYSKNPSFLSRISTNNISMLKLPKKQTINQFQIFLAYPGRNDSFFIFWIENRRMLLRQRKSSFKKISKGVSPHFLSKISHFSHRCFMGIFSNGRSFSDILDRKECFLDKKSQLIKKSKKSKFLF